MNDSGSGFVRDLRSELVAAANRRNERRRRRQRRALNGVAIVAVVLVAVTGVQSFQKPSEASVLDVRRENGRIRVDLKATNASTNEIVEELRDQGIDANITDVPSSPSEIGKFLSLAHSSDVGQLEPGSYKSFTLPNSKNQRIELSRGRPAKRGENYAMQPNAYARGEALHCSGTLGQKVGDAVSTLHSLNIDITYRFTSNEFSETRPEAAVLGDVINTASAVREGVVIISVSENPRPLVGALTDCA